MNYLLWNLASLSLFCVRFAASVLHLFILFSECLLAQVPSGVQEPARYISRKNTFNLYSLLFDISKGGGSGGSVREAGGSFGKMEAAREEEFFRRQQKQQLEKMKMKLDSHKQELEKQIQEHEQELKRLQEMIKNEK